MINIDIKNLNELEKDIFDKIKEYSKENPKMKIIEAADYCDCSTSKISKFVRKLGFQNFKQYTSFLYGNTTSKASSNELTRLKEFIEEFDEQIVLDVIALIENHSKIILFGYGPSLLCAQYFEYRLRTCTNKIVMATSDELSIASVIDDDTLILILTVTGTFSSFETIYDKAKLKGSEVAIIVEEYNSNLFTQCDRFFWLAKTSQADDLMPYEKSRTIFFIFLEEVVSKLQNFSKVKK